MFELTCIDDYLTIQGKYVRGALPHINAFSTKRAQTKSIYYYSLKFETKMPKCTKGSSNGEMVKTKPNHIKIH